MPDLPPIRVSSAGIVTAGPYTLEPSRKDWRRRRAWWRVRLAGAIIVPYRATPRLALLEAVRRAL